MRVVIIEDELPAARALGRRLEKLGLQPDVMLHSVEQSVIWFEENPQPDLIFLDIQLSVGRVVLRHRFRYEQRFMEGRDFNTRYRYCLFADIPINNARIQEKTVYIALYNEIFINGKRNEDTPALYDRDRIYLGAGYRLTKNFGIQLGWMNQMLEKTSKSQVMLSLHHTLPIRQSSSGNPEPARDSQ